MGVGSRISTLGAIETVTLALNRIDGVAEY